MSYVQTCLDGISVYSFAGFCILVSAERRESQVKAISTLDSQFPYSVYLLFLRNDLVSKRIEN